MQENLKDSSNPNLYIENDEETFTRQMRNMNINDNEEEKSVRIDDPIDVGSNLSDDEDSATRASITNQKSKYQVRKLLYRD